MAGKGTTFQNDLLKLIFNNVGIATIGDATGLVPSTAAGSLFASLHTADPSTGNQSTSEISYTGYARVAIARTTGGFTVSGNTATFVAAATFGAMTAGTGGTVTHGALGAATSGTGKVLYAGAVTPNLSVTTGVTPQLAATSNVTEA